jgi:hypothetical protein
MTKSKQPLAQTRRDALVSHIASRGKKTSNIWYVFSPGSRTDVVLLGDLRFELFLATEGDPDVATAIYEVEPVCLRIGQSDHSIQFDVLARHLDGGREYRDAREKPLGDTSTSGHEIPLSWKRAAAESAGASYTEFTISDLDALKQRTWNWARAIAALARCRNEDLGTLEIEVAARLADGRRQTIGDFLTGLMSEQPPLIVAAIVSLLRKRQLESDLDTNRWGKHSTVWAKAVST